MSIQIALKWSDETEVELKKMGFVKREVYIKEARAGKNSEESNILGDREFFEMSRPPYQFVTTSWWGACPD
jgi:hypothetical protein